MRKTFTPDAGTATGAATDVTDTQVRHMANVPAKDADLLQVSETVNAKWASSPFITLQWKTQAAFSDDVTAFKHNLERRNTAGGGRSQQTQAVENLDIQIEDALPYVKTYIAEKFGPVNATANYAEFGMEHRHNHYQLPEDRQRRKDALRMMADAIHANGFDEKTYGNAFWADLKTRYDAAVAAAEAGAGNVSSGVGLLVPLRTGLRNVLHSILLLLEANYPDTFVQARRDWGYQKGNY